MKDRPIHIVGFGIAGATLAWQLWYRKKPFSIIDPGGGSASKVSAGLMNPIVFRHITKSWMADEFLVYADKFYTRTEIELSEKFLNRLHIRRLFASDRERETWANLRKSGKLSPYLADADHEISGISDPFGQGIVSTIGFLDVKKFLDTSRHFFIANGVRVESEQCELARIRHDEIYVFCQGDQLTANPFFGYLPVKPVHGETIIVECPELNCKEVINRGCFVQPLGNHRYRVGATFNWDLTQPVTTSTARTELIQKLMVFLDLPFKVADQQAGIRATVSDRKPLLGRHPGNERLYVFGGLGTKGIMSAPHLSVHMAELITENRPVLKEADIYRWQKRFVKQQN